MRNILLTIEYDGIEFHGWQQQPGLRTVQGALQDALNAVILGTNKDAVNDADNDSDNDSGNNTNLTESGIAINGTSRTDAGVHALGQCCSFSGDFGIPTENIMKAVNNYLCNGRTGAGHKPGAIRIVDCREVPEDFHARFSAVGKTYRYVISTGEPDIFRRNYCYYVDAGSECGGTLDIDAMKKAAEHIIGTHDFACFQSAGGNPRETTVRTIFDLRIMSGNDGLDRESGGKVGDKSGDKVGDKSADIIIEVTGDGFLYNMVRIIVGTLVEVGLGKRSPESVAHAIEMKDRSLAGHTAPAEGLYLLRVYFDRNEMPGSDSFD